MQVGDKVKARIVGILSYGFVMHFYADDVRYRAILKHNLCSFDVSTTTIEKGAVLDCVIHKIKAKEIVLDNRNHDLNKENFNKIEMDSIFSGTVINTTDFGLFIQNADGLKGMVHKSDLSYQKSATPHQYNHGDIVSAMVISKSIVGNKLRLGLSTKALEQDPWGDSVLEAVGNTYSGVVNKVQVYGTFIGIADLGGIDCLLHVSNYSENFVPECGMELKVVVQSVNQERQRISIVLPDNSTED